ncbi:MAG: RagB/SusD family nutrient uptake outer membrane protein, partial [Bacteroidales bacterium]|nr:RagB/SusD family nutrient uptake outer membrane protein [Bacteroidales bacterium]
RASQPTVAVSALNALRVKRGLSELPTTLTGAALFTAIQEERTREMLCEGTRLDDLKRWGLGFSRKAPQNANMVLTGTAASGLSVEANNQKFVWEIPANDLQTNKNLVPNWQ